MTAASLALGMPRIFVLTKFVPQVVGKPKEKEPLLKISFILLQSIINGGRIQLRSIGKISDPQ